jgi:hypothetical protein
VETRKDSSSMSSRTVERYATQRHLLSRELATNGELGTFSQTRKRTERRVVTTLAWTREMPDDKLRCMI